MCAMMPILRKNRKSECAGSLPMIASRAFSFFSQRGDGRGSRPGGWPARVPSPDPSGETVVRPAYRGDAGDTARVGLRIRPVSSGRRSATALASLSNNRLDFDIESRDRRALRLGTAGRDLGPDSRAIEARDDSGPD